MVDQLFKKAALCSDVHFGRSSNNPVANEDNLDFFRWFIDESKTWGAETCVMLGDWHDSRNSLGVSTLNYSLQAMEMLNDAFERVWWITGNHDLLYRNKRDVSSVVFAKHLPNIQIVDQPLTVGDCTILPWLLGDERDLVKKIKSRYVFGHLELPNYMMNARCVMPCHGNGVTDEDFRDRAEYVFSGHFHFRQSKPDSNVIYIGNIMPFNFSDVDDIDRGACFLEWGQEPFFKAWPNQPLFRAFTLSQLLNEPDKHLADKLTARVTLDIDISYEEAQVIKETYCQGTGVRRMELVHAPRNTSDQTFSDENIVFQSVDQIVTEGLLDVKSKGLDPAKLVEIYKALPNL